MTALWQDCQIELSACHVPSQASCHILPLANWSFSISYHVKRMLRALIGYLQVWKEVMYVRGVVHHSHMLCLKGRHQESRQPLLDMKVK